MEGLIQNAYVWQCHWKCASPISSIKSANLKLSSKMRKNENVSALSFMYEKKISNLASKMRKIHIFIWNAHEHKDSDKCTRTNLRYRTPRSHRGLVVQDHDQHEKHLNFSYIEAYCTVCCYCGMHLPQQRAHSSQSPPQASLWPSKPHPGHKFARRSTWKKAWKITLDYTNSQNEFIPWNYSI